MDRRAFRTRSRLQRAHVSLLLKKGYEATTVKDICHAAKVGRSTFYAHYSGKDDLRRSCFQGLRRQLTAWQGQSEATADCGAPAFSFSLPLFEHARDHVNMYRALIGGRGAAISLAEIRSIVASLIRTELRGARNLVERDISVAYIVGAFMAVLTWWLEDGATLPPRQMDETFRRLATRGIAA